MQAKGRLLGVDAGRVAARAAFGFALAGIAAAWVGAGCSEGAVEDGGFDRGRNRTIELRSRDVDPMSLSTEGLEALATDLDRRIATGAADRQDPGRAARVAEALALRQPSPEHLERARAKWVAAAESGDVVERCSARLELARFEARVAGDLMRTREQVSALLGTFAGQSAAEDCVASARRIALIVGDQGIPSHGPGGAGAPQQAVDDFLRAHLAASGRGSTAAVLRRVAAFGPRDRSAARHTRVVLELDTVVAFALGGETTGGTSGGSFWIDLPRTRPAPGLGTVLTVQAGGLDTVRVVAARSGETRVIFQAGASTRHRLFPLTDPFRLVLDFEREDPAAGAAITVRPARPSPAARSRTIVLDPGHGGDDFGARENGLREARLTLDITERVAALLARQLPGIRVLLTRDRDEILSLEARAAFANAVEAEAFISIHLNAADEEVDRGGVTTFVLDTNNDRQALRLAARENGTSTREVSGLSQLLATFHRRQQVEQSQRLASHVQSATLRGGRRILPGLHDRGVRSAMFYVLVGARMPAVLVEASFLTQPEENRALATTAYRQALADGIADGLVAYLAESPAPAP